eukprot:COSAG06_NODE_1790_length_8394_cov_34.639301_4_plen_75_part_00
MIFLPRQARDKHRENSKKSTVSLQGVMNAALLGLAEDAFMMALQRAFLPPAPGAKWIGFAQHLQVSYLYWRGFI